MTIRACCPTTGVTKQSETLQGRLEIVEIDGDGHLESRSTYRNDGSAFVTSPRSHDVKDQAALLKAIRADVNELYDKSSRVMSGTTASGTPVSIDPDTVGGRGVLVIVPRNRQDWVRAIASTLDTITDSADTVIRVVPARGWRSRK